MHEIVRLWPSIVSQCQAYSINFQLADKCCFDWKDPPLLYVLKIALYLVLVEKAKVPLIMLLPQQHD